MGVRIPAFCPIVSRFAATKKNCALVVREYTVPWWQEHRSETLVCSSFGQLTRLLARRVFTEFSRHESWDSKPKGSSWRVILRIRIIQYSQISLRSSSSSFSSIGTTAHCGLWPVEQCASIFSYLPHILSIFSLPALEDLFLLPLSIFFWVFPFFSSLPALEWRFFWATYPPPFSLGDITSLSFTLLSILLYFLLCPSLLGLNSSDFYIPPLENVYSLSIIFL